MIFKNRYDASKQLVAFLRKYSRENGVVLAIPKGAVPIGYIIANKLSFPLDIILTKKIGHPTNAELAIGSVSIENQITDPRFHIDEAYIDQETLRLRRLLKERYRKYMGNRKPINVNNKTVIIVDDGVATGNTMLASIDLVRKHNPKKIIVAIPVASSDAMKKLSKKADDVICLHIPDKFKAVGQFYTDFSQVKDEEVSYLLNEIYEDRNSLKIF
jgi:putative phosphoribosyl transferase